MSIKSSDKLRQILEVRAQGAGPEAGPPLPVLGSVREAQALPTLDATKIMSLLLIYMLRMTS
jgi:hypothetical protein